MIYNQSYDYNQVMKNKKAKYVYPHKRNWRLLHKFYEHIFKCYGLIGVGRFVKNGWLMNEEEYDSCESHYQLIQLIQSRGSYD